MRNFYCTDDAQPCLRQCRACAETVSVNNAWERDQIERREREADDELNPPTGDTRRE